MPPPRSTPVRRRAISPELVALRDKSDELAKKIDELEKELAKLLEELEEARDSNGWAASFLRQLLGITTPVGALLTATLVGVHILTIRKALQPKGRDD